MDDPWLPTKRAPPRKIAVGGVSTPSQTPVGTPTAGASSYAARAKAARETTSSATSARGPSPALTPAAASQKKSGGTGIASGYRRPSSAAAAPESTPTSKRVPVFARMTGGGEKERSPGAALRGGGSGAGARANMSSSQHSASHTPARSVQSARGSNPGAGPAKLTASLPKYSSAASSALLSLEQLARLGDDIAPPPREPSSAGARKGPPLSGAPAESGVLPSEGSADMREYLARMERLLDDIQLEHIENKELSGQRALERRKSRQIRAVSRSASTFDPDSASETGSTAVLSTLQNLVSEMDTWGSTPVPAPLPPSPSPGPSPERAQPREAQAQAQASPLPLSMPAGGVTPGPVTKEEKSAAVERLTSHPLDLREISFDSEEDCAAPPVMPRPTAPSAAVTPHMQTAAKAKSPAKPQRPQPAAPAPMPAPAMEEEEEEEDGGVGLSFAADAVDSEDGHTSTIKGFMDTYLRGASEAAHTERLDTPLQGGPGRLQTPASEDSRLLPSLPSPPPPPLLSQPPADALGATLGEWRGEGAAAPPVANVSGGGEANSTEAFPSITLSPCPDLPAPDSEPSTHREGAHVPPIAAGPDSAQKSLNRAALGKLAAMRNQQHQGKLRQSVHRPEPPPDPPSELDLSRRSSSGGPPGPGREGAALSPASSSGMGGLFSPSQAAAEANRAAFEALQASSKIDTRLNRLKRGIGALFGSGKEDPSTEELVPRHAPPPGQGQGMGMGGDTPVTSPPQSPLGPRGQALSALKQAALRRSRASLDVPPPAPRPRTAPDPDDLRPHEIISPPSNARPSRPTTAGPFNKYAPPLTPAPAPGVRSNGTTPRSAVPLPRTSTGFARVITSRVSSRLDERFIPRNGDKGGRNARGGAPSQIASSGGSGSTSRPAWGSSKAQPPLGRTPSQRAAHPSQSYEGGYEYSYVSPYARHNPVITPQASLRRMDPHAGSGRLSMSGGLSQGGMTAPSPRGLAGSGALSARRNALSSSGQGGARGGAGTAAHTGGSDRSSAGYHGAPAARAPAPPPRRPSLTAQGPAERTASLQLQNFGVRISKTDLLEP